MNTIIIMNDHRTGICARKSSYTIIIMSIDKKAFGLKNLRQGYMGMIIWTHWDTNQYAIIVMMVFMMMSIHYYYGYDCYYYVCSYCCCTA
jgi:hypothetical protein